ncbi:MAG: zinc permease [Thermoplasmata archaeon]|nr:zinc permease [Thermoplasmata archaeon]
MGKFGGLLAGPSEWQVLGLGATAGFTIFLGLAYGLRGRSSNSTRAFLSALAAGILLFLFYDVLKNANELINQFIPAQGGSSGTLAVLAIGILLAGWSIGFLSLGLFERAYLSRARRSSSGAPIPSDLPIRPFEIDPLAISTMIAVGIGLHNFSEGLAIGTAYAGGAVAAGTVLVIGFAAHNSTEGFGILGPGLIAGRQYSPARLFLLGIVGGGPTFVGTIVGSQFHSSFLSVLFYGLAAGAIVYVVLEMIRPMMARETRSFAWAGVVVGFILGFATDAIVTFGGG